MDYAAESKQSDIVDDLLQYFVSKGLNDCFTACLMKCYDLIKPDVVLELAWRYKINDFIMPYMMQVLRDYNQSLERLEEDAKERKEDVKEQQRNG